MRILGKQALVWVAIVCVIFVGAIFLPDLVGKWQQYQDSTAVSHITFDYKPYSGNRFDSVADELDAMAELTKNDIDVDSLQLAIRQLSVSKEDIKSTIENELDMLYTNELLPEPIHIAGIERISYHELIPEDMATYDIDESKESVSNIDSEQHIRIPYWNVECDVDAGFMTVCLDSGMKKILCLHVRGEKENNEIFEQWKTHSIQKSIEDMEWVNKAWSKYYGYAPENINDLSSYNSFVDNIWEENGSFSTSYDIVTSSGEQLEMVVEMMKYDENIGYSDILYVGVGLFSNF